jgi:S-adenosylmethionine:tRNA ribosyltransferase-isomerase
VPTASQVLAQRLFMKINFNAASSIKDFSYDLPDNSIAKYPLTDRDQSKLLQWENNKISDHMFCDLPGLLPEHSVLVFNNTRVIRARLHFMKSTGAKIEVFCLEPTQPHDYILSFAQTNTCCWKCIVGNLKKWKGEVLEMRVAINKEGLNQPSGAVVVLSAEMVGDLEGGYEVKFSWNNSGYTFAEILEAAGNMPIPPYLRRESEEIDLTVYQTVYSKIKGSVAAPTAGLHFTGQIFKQLAERNILCQELTLHVGAGTFQPVKSDTIGEHRMHTEHFSVSKVMLDNLIAHPGKVFAVGTTSVRTLESLYWTGCKILQNPGIETDQLWTKQWEPYEKSVTEVDAKTALSAVSAYMAKNGLTALETSTQIMILPGYRFRVIAGLVTNFHQPQSTLLLLISAILGDDWRRVYSHALSEGYRFLSYGDANLYLIGE